MKFNILKEIYPVVEKKMKSLERKANKYGSEFRFEIVGDFVEEVENDGIKKFYEFYIVDVDGNISCGEFECVAVLEMHPSGNIIRRINMDIDIPERFLTSGNVCEHCGSIRRRKQTYVVYNHSTGEYKQVGKDCLKLYTRGIDPKMVASYYDMLHGLEESDGCYGGYQPTMYAIEDVLSYAYEIIQKTGYIKRQFDYVKDSYNQSFTSGLVSELFYNNGIEKAIKEINKCVEFDRLVIDGKKVEFSKSDFCKDDTHDFVQEVIEYYKNLDGDSEFLHNVKILLSEEYVSSKNFGYLCYLPQGYMYHLQKLEEQKVKAELRKKIGENSTHFGIIGNRYKDVQIANMRCLTYWYTQFGCTSLYQIIIATGEVLTWKSTKEVDVDWATGKKIDFTVKNHSSYNGVEQTEITRAKIH